MDRKEPGHVTEEPRLARRFLGRKAAAKWANVSISTFERWRISDLEQWLSDLA